MNVQSESSHENGKRINEKFTCVEGALEGVDNYIKKLLLVCVCVCMCMYVCVCAGENMYVIVFVHSGQCDCVYDCGLLGCSLVIGLVLSYYVLLSDTICPCVWILGW